MEIILRFWRVLVLSCLFLVIPTLQDKFKPQSLYPKIGTHEQNSHLCFIILKKEYRAEGTHPKARSAGSIKLENLRKELLTAALPPQRHSVYSIGSRHLGASTSRGTWGLILDRAPGKVAWDKYRKVIRKYAVIGQLVNLSGTSIVKLDKSVRVR